MNERQDDSTEIDSDGYERDSLSSRFEFETIVNILKTRFSDYSDDAPSLTVLSSALDSETLRKIL